MRLYGDYDVIDSNGKHIATMRKGGMDPRNMAYNLIRARPIHGCTVMTICSSISSSPDAGHYMQWEYERTRQKRRRCESLPPGPAVPLYLEILQGGKSWRTHWLA